MALAGSQSNSPFLAHLPQKLPATQAEWQQHLNGLQAWARSLTTHSWITPTLLNGWMNYGAEYEPAGFYKDAAGVVHLRGLVKSGTVGAATPIFTLPTGLIPPYTVIRAGVTSADVFNEIRVGGVSAISLSPGAVAAYNGSNAWVSLSGISFSTTP